MCQTLTERQIKILFDIISARFRGFEPVKASPLNTALETADQQTTTTGKGIYRVTTWRTISSYTHLYTVLRLTELIFPLYPPLGIPYLQNSLKRDHGTATE